MSQMLTNIKRIVKEDISKRTTYRHALNEAIINAIHANATRIICRFTADQDVLNANEGEIIPRKVTTIEVEDDGDGFNDQNYKSFGKYRSDYNAKLGCKGVGRFVFLKLFKQITYTSWLSEDNEKREFSFGYDFESEDLHKEDVDVSENRTLLNLSGPTTEYFNENKHVDRRLDLNLSEIKEKVLAHLVPMLFLRKREGVSIYIEFYDNTANEIISISEDDIPDFEKEEFLIEGTDNELYPFTLYYKISKSQGSFNAFYCANKRTVCAFSDKDLRISLPTDFSAYFLLESDYFDSHINNERNDFDIYPVRTDLFNVLSWDIINTDLKKVISSLVKVHIPDAIQMNRGQLSDIQKERPYLADYIEPEDLDIAGFIDKDYIVRKAKKRFDDAKEKILSHAGKPEYTDDELQDAIQITQNELVAYIQDRIVVIERLKTMLEDKEKTEKIIHNLFMEQYTDDDYFCVGKNNLWLLDDRFTSYSYAASDKRIEEILEKIKLEEGTAIEYDRPDLALFFSHDPRNKKALKSVLIELKSFKDQGKSHHKKYAGIAQLMQYIKAFKSKEDVKEIWAFLVTDVDSKLEELLEADGYIPLFSTGRAIYYRYYEKLESFIYVFGVQTLISDAESRNKIFIDIINKHSRLNKLLSEQIPDAGRELHGTSS